MILGLFMVCKYLILLHPKIVKMLHLDFFDSFYRSLFFHQNSDYIYITNSECKTKSDIFSGSYLMESRITQGFYFRVIFPKVPLLGMGVNILFKCLQYRLPDRGGPFVQPRQHILTTLHNQPVIP